MKIVFATHNNHKLKEVRAFLPSHIEVISLNELGCFEAIEETANTLEGNAQIKADFVYEKYGIACFADDTGLEVKALDGAPGVYSARFAGENATDKENRKKILKQMLHKTDTSAQFRTVIALRLSKKEIHFFEGICEGEILNNEQGENGFGYDSIFMPKGYDRSFAEMDLNHKNKISHRGKAIRLLSDYFINHCNKLI